MDQLFIAILVVIGLFFAASIGYVSGRKRERELWERRLRGTSEDPIGDDPMYWDAPAASISTADFGQPTRTFWTNE